MCLGLVVAPKAMKIAIEKASDHGSGWVSVRNSNHFGIAAYHAMMALEKDMIGMSMTNASPLVTPTHSAERLLGRSEEHTSELQSLMRISYAVFCLKKKHNN